MTIGRPTVRNVHLLSAVSVLFLLPNILLAMHLKRLPMLAILLGSAGFIMLMVRRKSPADGLLAEGIRARVLVICLASACALLVLGGEGHVFFANWDWLFRDAVLADLTRAPTLPIYQFAGQTYLLRAPLGMYLLPAFLGHLTSLETAHAVLLIQNAALLTGILYLVDLLSARRGLLVALVFVAFSGLDIVGELLVGLAQGDDPLALHLPSHIETWSRILQYSSHVTQIFWVPNHALPGWWFAMLALLCARGEIGVGALGLSLATTLIWSPLAFIGALPIAGAVLLLRLGDLRRNASFPLAAACALCFLPVAVYLTADTSAVPHRMLLDIPGFWFIDLRFMLVEIPQAIVVLAAWPRLDPSLRPLLVVALAALVVLPLFQFGANNDLVMRASIPALAVLAFAFGQVLAGGWRPHPVVFAAGLTMALAGAVTPGFEIARSLLFHRFAISDCNMISAWQALRPQDWLANYLARPSAMPSWLLEPARTATPLGREATPCWPDHPFDPTAPVWLKSNAELRTSPNRLPSR